MGLQQLALVPRGIEFRPHYRRDDTLKEDRCTVQTGHAVHALAVLNNLILGLLLHRGVENVPDERRRFDRYPDQALALIVRRP